MTNRQFKLLTALLATVALMVAACGNKSTPTLAYKSLYEAVKKKDSEAIKKNLTKGTLDMMKTYAEMQKKTLDQVVENGLTETTFAPSLPETRNEKITGDVAILEVKNEKTGGWDALPFAREDGQWKLAIDTYFRGTMSPNGPTNPDHPGELPAGAQPGTPQGTAPTAPGAPQPPLKQGAQPSLKQGAQPGLPPAPGAMPPAPAAPAPTQSAKPGAPPENKKDIKPPTR
jgi:hypothetical protein